MWVNFSDLYHPFFWQGQQVVYRPNRYEALPLERVCFQLGDPQAQRRRHWLFWPPVSRNWRVTGDNYKRFPDRRRQGWVAGRQYRRRIEQGWCRRSRDGRLGSTRNHGNTKRRISRKKRRHSHATCWRRRATTRSRYRSTAHLSRKRPRWDWQTYMYCWKNLAPLSPEKLPKSEGATAEKLEKWLVTEPPLRWRPKRATK